MSMKWAVVLAGCIATSVTACGGDDDTSGSGGSSSGGASGGSAGTTGGTAGSGGVSGSSSGGGAGLGGSAGSDASVCVPPEAGTVAEVNDCAGAPVAQTVEIQNFAFSPASATAKVGEVVKFENLDISSHTSTSGTPSCSAQEWDTGTLEQNATKCVKFLVAGNYPYFCFIHPSMVGSVTVTN